MSGQNNFYSKNWNQKNVFVVYSRPHYDILIDDKYVYLIKIPDYNSGLWTWLALGFALSFLGDSADKTKREEYLSSWVDSEGNVVSTNFEKDVFLKLSLVDLSKFLIYKKNGIISDGFILNHNGKKMVLQNSRQEYHRLMEYLDRMGIQVSIEGILN